MGINTLGFPPLVPSKDFPVGIGLKKNDIVNLIAISNATGTTVQLNLNITEANGDVSTQTASIVATSNRTVPVAAFTNPLPDGVITSASITLLQGTTPANPGNLYVRAALLRSGSFNAIVCSGYVYTGSPGVSFPGPLVGLQDGPGRIYNVAPTSPAAGAEISITVPAQTVWRIMSLQFTLVTSSVANNRTHHLTVDDGTTANKMEQGLGETPTQAASTTRNFIYQTSGWTALETAFDANNFIRLPLRLPRESKSLLGGNRIKTVSTLLDAADQYTINQLWVEEWITG